MVTSGHRRWSLRISQNLSLAQVRAEHRLLAQLARAGLPFAVPAPVALPDGDTVADSPGGPVTLCEWIPEVRPDPPWLWGCPGRCTGRAGRAGQRRWPGAAPGASG
jgi:Ser/Thr protein kinase RdoA (MazF antagonist)